MAEKRLKAIEEFADLGAGFKIAMRDLEIRGAGNILGAEQHGHIHAVGYDLYCKLLETAVKRARNEPVSERPEVSISLGLASFMPDDYIGDPKQKIEIYRRLNRADSMEDVRALASEMEDRFGKPPVEVLTFLEQVELRVLARRAAISSLALSGGVVIARSQDPPRTKKGLSKIAGCVRQVDERMLHIVLPPGMRRPHEILSHLKDALA